jgi:hypothetical protein
LGDCLPNISPNQPTIGKRFAGKSRLTTMEFYGGDMNEPTKELAKHPSWPFKQTLVKSKWVKKNKVTKRDILKTIEESPF